MLFKVINVKTIVKKNIICKFWVVVSPVVFMLSKLCTLPFQNISLTQLRYTLKKNKECLLPCKFVNI